MFVAMDKTFEFNGTQIRYQEYSNDPLVISTPDFFKALGKPEPSNLTRNETEWITLSQAVNFAADNQKMMDELNKKFPSYWNVISDGHKA